MIKKLRWRFITIAMISISLVLIAILAGLHIANYININNNLDERLSMLADFDGRLPDMQEGGWFQTTPPPSNEDNAPPQDPEGLNFHDVYTHLSVETPFNTRYFTVNLDASGNVLWTDLSHIAAVDNEDAQALALQLYSDNKSNGFYRNYKYTRIDKNDCTSYIFLDSSQELQTFYNFLWASLAISAAALILFFLFVLLFSKIVMRPVFESYAKQKRFITDASHEIKTPLTIIDANAEILELEQGQNEWITGIHHQVKRLTDMTNQLVFLSRMDEEVQAVDYHSFDFTEAILDTANPFEQIAKANQIDFQISAEEGITYYGDEGQLRQVISILLDNAIKYVAPVNDQQLIKLTLKKAGRSIQCQVWNTCSPMEVGKKDILFERFYRADSSRNSKTGGHGIGLSIAYAIVTNHKGKITAKSEDGSSILFSITL